MLLDSHTPMKEIYVRCNQKRYRFAEDKYKWNNEWITSWRWEDYFRVVWTCNVSQQLLWKNSRRFYFDIYTLENVLNILSLKVVYS